MTPPTCPDCSRPLDAIERRHASAYRGLCRTCWGRWAERWATAPEVEPGRHARTDDEGPSGPAVPLVECVEACRDSHGHVTAFAWREEDVQNHGSTGPHMHCPACGREWRIQRYQPVLGADYPNGYLRRELMVRSEE